MRMNPSYRITLFLTAILTNNIVKCEVNSADVNKTENPDSVFNGVYTECFFHLSYSCLQNKTLLYLRELNNLSEVSVIGDYVKFVKINTTDSLEDDGLSTGSTDELAFLIDKAVDDFFNNHILKFNVLGKDTAWPRNMEEFVGRKKRKGGDDGGGHMGGHDDGGKKKMMMMAMMCMKMKLMMMVPAMMGMMGMMSFKGMMFSMMSFMLSKMMLLMKILEKKGGAGGVSGSGAGDGGWAASGAGGGAWMPAGGQDYAGGGYDANGQWQSRSIAEHLGKYNTISKEADEHSAVLNDKIKENRNVDEAGFRHETAFDNPYHLSPEISFVKPIVRYNSHMKSDVFKNPVLLYKKSNVEFSNDNPVEITDEKETLNGILTKHTRAKRSTEAAEIFEPDFDGKSKDNKIVIRKKVADNEVRSRTKRSLIDILQNSYIYWINKLLGINNNRRANLQRYRIINGIKYVYYPRVQKVKMPKEMQLTTAVKVADEFKPIITADFNKGEIMEGAVESRMNKKKLHKMKDTVNETVDENPWE